MYGQRGFLGNIRTVSREAAEEAAFVVCLAGPPNRRLVLPDNAVARCHDCGGPIQHRPDVPKRRRKSAWTASGSG